MTNYPTVEPSPELKVVSDALVTDVLSTSDLTRPRAVDLVYGRAQDHLGFLYSANQEEPLQEILLWILEAVQDDLIEGSGTLPRAGVWPQCPDHPNHPLQYRTENTSTAVWTCPATRRLVADLGKL